MYSIHVFHLIGPLLVQYSSRTGKLILTFGEYMRALDQILTSAWYSTRLLRDSCTSNTARSTVLHTGWVQAQLFLIKTLQGYRLALSGKRVHDEELQKADG